MAASPWKQFEAMEPDREYFVMASHLPLKSMGATPRMLGLASAVRRQLKDTPGIVGYSLDAKVFAKDYFTLSVWEDEAALRAVAADLVTTVDAHVQRAGAEENQHDAGGDAGVDVELAHGVLLGSAGCVYKQFASPRQS